VILLLTVDCCLSILFLLLQQCHLVIVLFEGLHARSLTLSLQSSWSRYRGHVMPFLHAPGNNWPCISVGHHVHAYEVLKHYTPDENQAIHRMISYEMMYQMKHEVGPLTTRLSQELEHQPILVGSAYHTFMPHLKGYLAGEYPGYFYCQRWKVKTPTYSHIDQRLLCLSCRVVPSVFRLVLLASRYVNVIENNTLGRSNIFWSGSVAASS
jgi:hypothetical protein